MEDVEFTVMAIAYMVIFFYFFFVIGAMLFQDYEDRNNLFALDDVYNDSFSPSNNLTLMQNMSSM